jgi:hypothetical protein
MIRKGSIVVSSRKVNGDLVNIAVCSTAVNEYRVDTVLVGFVVEPQFLSNAGQSQSLVKYMQCIVR